MRKRDQTKVVGYCGNVTKEPDIYEIVSNPCSSLSPASIRSIASMKASIADDCVGVGRYGFSFNSSPFVLTRVCSDGKEYLRRSSAKGI